MKYYIGFIFILVSHLHLSAQNTVQMSAVKSNDFGVAYTLPKTAITITANVSKTTKTAGEFYQYAERYLNVSNPITQDEVIYKLDNVQTETSGIPNKDKSYLVEFKSNSVGAFVTLTNDGMICAINQDIKLDKNTSSIVDKQNTTNIKTINPKTFLSEEILRAGSTSKQAELIAKQIYRLRESKTNILTGEAENMPPDGNAYKIVMEQIDQQEKALTSIFIGTESVETFIKEFTIVPDDKNIDRKIIFRFSTKLGVVGDNDLSGAPVFLSLTNKEPHQAVLLSPKEQKAMDEKFSKGIIYNIPSKANLSIQFNNKTLLQKEYDIVQYGIQEVLAPKMLENGKQPVKVIFHPELGAVKQIIQ